MKKEFNHLLDKFSQTYEDVPTDEAEIEINQAMRNTRKKFTKK
jgi:hypothetical protein